MEKYCETDLVQPVLRKNFYVTLSGWFYTPAFRHLLDVMGPERIMFATDYPMEDSSMTSKWFEELDISDSVKEQIAFRTAANLFGIDLESELEKEPFPDSLSLPRADVQRLLLVLVGVSYS